MHSADVVRARIGCFSLARRRFSGGRTDVSGGPLQGLSLRRRGRARRIRIRKGMGREHLAFDLVICGQHDVICRRERMCLKAGPLNGRNRLLVGRKKRKPSYHSLKILSARAAPLRSPLSAYSGRSSSRPTAKRPSIATSPTTTAWPSSGGTASPISRRSAGSPDSPSAWLTSRVDLLPDKIRMCSKIIKTKNNQPDVRMT